MGTRPRDPPRIMLAGPEPSVRSRGAPARLIAALGAMILPVAPAPARQEPAAYPMACHYVRTELDRHAHCARRAGAMIRLAPAHAARLPFHHGLAEVAIPGLGWLWVRPDGLGLPVFTLDNGPDPFAQGLVRGRYAGKVAFYDRRLRRVLATPYDWAYPFNARGQALACTGCHSDGRAPASMVGGLWSLIDRHGRILEPPAARGGRAFTRYFGR